MERKIYPPACSRCEGTNRVWIERIEDGFDRGWEEPCELCKGTGYEPEPVEEEPEEPAASCHTAR